MPQDLQLDLEIKLPKTRNNYKGSDIVDTIFVPNDQKRDKVILQAEDQSSEEVTLKKPSIVAAKPVSISDIAVSSVPFGFDNVPSVAPPTVSIPAKKVGWLKKQGKHYL